MPFGTELLLQAARRVLPREERARIEQFCINDAGHGYDAFGLSPKWLPLGLFVTSGLYRRWFRVVSHGIENIPRRGPVILAANHGGILPFDAMMLWGDVVRRTDPPRIPRAIIDNFVPLMPFVSTFFARNGAVGGSRGNVHQLLDQGELLMIFPEGTTGIGKPFRERGKLQDWRVGHAEMAIRHEAAVVPVAIVGPDDQFPLVWRAPVSAFGSPYVPLSLIPFPLPVRYEIWYGAPMTLHEGLAPGDSDRPEVAQAAADRVRAAEQVLLDQALASYPGRFS